MNDHFLLLLRKDDIIDIFKYGRWKTQCPSIKFSGTIEEVSSNKKLMDKLFKQSNPFDYSLDYFILHVISPTASSFEVDDIVDIYALDSDSFKIGLSLSPEIRLSEPIFKEYYLDFQIANEIIDAQKGVDNIFAIFDLPHPKTFIKKKELETVIKDSFLGLSPQGNNSIWYYLLRYERHQSYPKDNRGFALDAIHALLNYERKSYVDISLTRSGVGKLIFEQSPDIKYSEILTIIESQSKFLKHCEKVQKGFYKIAPLYLTLKYIFADGIRDEKPYFGSKLDVFIERLKEKYDNEVLRKALYLLGIVLGRENTYQYVYKKNKLQILK